ncbi:MAG TPA: DUF882 domain-containing protein, partial [Burkholderiaceae bacterium]|nr:DUF882 domain-containing protein [Burkholderiaceae bacterium]
MAYLHRRAFLRASSVVALSAASSFAFPAFAKVAAPAVIGTKNIDCRTLVMNNIHNGEKLKSDYWVEGNYIPEELAHINKFLRDYRNNKVLPIDPKLLDLLHQIDGAVDARSGFEIICGYRSPETNEWLRKHSSGVAEHSLHLKGQAIDMCVPGRSLKKVHEAALSLGLGGVGYYPDSDFIHVD